MKDTFSQKPKRSLGQNFLIDPFYQKKIAGEIFKQPDANFIIEIGPGRGAITQHLLPSAKSLLLIEKDDEYAKYWKNELKQKPQCEVWHGDAQDWPIDTLKHASVMVIGNLPYNVATPLLLRFLRHGHRFKQLTFMLQKEVAQKCVAKPGSKNYGPLGVACQFLSLMYTVCDVPPQAFKPKPRVDSRVMSFVPKVVHESFPVEKFLYFVGLAFSQRRKMLRVVLAKHNIELTDFPNKDVFLKRRAESLSHDELIFLFEHSLLK